MIKTVDFLRNKVFYLATVDENGKPKVRPFGALGVLDDKVYICTNSKKEVSKQMKSNPFVEISATADNMDWIRVSGEAILDDSQSTKDMMFEQNPNLSNIYGDKRDIFEVFYLKNVKSQINGIDGSIKVAEEF